MAKRKKRKQKEIDKKPFLGLEKDVMKGIWSVLFIAAAILIVLSFFNRAGALGDFLKASLQDASGWGMYASPILLIAISAAFLMSRGKNTNKSILLGALFLYFSILGFFALSTQSEYLRGGYLGKAVLWPLLTILGGVAAAVVLAAIFIISILLVFNISVVGIITHFRERRRLYKDALEVEKISLPNKKDKPEFKVKTLGSESSGISFLKKNKDKIVKSTKHSGKESSEDKEVNSDVTDFKGAITPTADFNLPPVDLLEPESGKPTSGDIVGNANIIKRTLQNFGIDVEMGEVNVGPTVTQYTLKPAEGIKLTRILALNNDLSLALAVHPIRIEAPIPGRSLVGIEIPNKAATWVRLRDLIANPEFEKSIGLTLCLGRDVSGVPVYANLARMPHLLVAGSTGSGKTIALNAIILSLIYKIPPQYLRFILIDPKRVEFSLFADIPYLLGPIITDNNKAINSLKWAVGEMERRFGVLSEAHVRDISSYNANKKIIKEEGPMPYIVIIIDELADLMASKGREVEALIVRIAQMARAVGIHLVLATQRPSVEVITGLIKANITARIAFQAASQVDSRTVLDMAGAEKLLGSGDMLFLPPDKSRPIRIQGAYIHDKEVKKVVEYIRNQTVKIDNDMDVESLSSHAQKPHNGHDVMNFDNFDSTGADDDLYKEAYDIVVKSHRASASLLQRRLRIGYARAARMLDLLEERDVIGPGEGAKPREVYVNVEEERGEDDLKTYVDENDKGEKD